MTAEPVLDVVAPSTAEIPLLVSIPHTGTHVPADILARFADGPARLLPDTDWHLHRLYDFVPALGAWSVHARLSRYVVDLNRAPGGTALYPGRNETSLVPVNTFANEPIYRDGAAPDEAEIISRRQQYWDPYHAELTRRLRELVSRHGYALLFDAHSITGFVPRFHPEPLPGLMLGDVDGTSAHPSLSAAVLDVHRASGISWRHNSPFKGGWITRAFGRPAEHVHAVQLEMSQRLYMDERPPFRWRDDLAETLRPVLRATLLALVDAARRLYAGEHA